MKTSDEILRKLKKLKEHIEMALPACKVIISLPLIRRDSIRANTILENLRVKLRRMNYELLDNSNIRAFHLGQKGLHLNRQGTKKIASNIISLIKRL